MHTVQANWISGITALFLLCLSRPSAAGVGGRQDLLVTFVSPLPNSRYVHPGTNIIIRTDRLPDYDVASKLIHSVTGTQSGKHNYAIRLSDDGRTLTCQPEIPFATAEEVTIEIDTTAARWAGPASAGKFSFTTTGKTQGETALWQQLRSADLPQAVYPKRQAGRKGLPSAVSGLVLPNISVTVSGATSPGYLFLAPIISITNPVPALIMMNNDGTMVFASDLQANAYDFKPQPNGMLTYYDNVSSTFVVMDQSFTAFDNIQCGNGYITDIHDLRILPNGHALLLGQDPQIVDMSQIVPGGYPQAMVDGYIIQELDTNRNVVFQWRSWDHYQITDAEHIDFTATSIDYVHGNALDVDTDGNILFSSRHLSEITKINRETGDIIWRLGGKNNQFRFVNDSIGFSYQHGVRRIANGDITLFDNGNFHTPPFSRAVEYALDTSTMTATLVWQYRNTPDVFGFALGYVQRMQNGNTLIGWGDANPTVTEVTADGTKVYEMTFEPGIVSYRAFRYVWPQPLPIQLTSFSLSAETSGAGVMLSWSTESEVNDYGFEVQRRALHDAGFATIPGGFVPGHGTTSVPREYSYVDRSAPGGMLYYRLKQIDLDGAVQYSDPAKVDMHVNLTAPGSPEEFSLAQSFPNPFNPTTTIRYGLPQRSHVTLAVHNTLGQLVSTLVNDTEDAGYHDAKFDGTDLASGVYFYRIQAGSFVETRKFLLIR